MRIISSLSSFGLFFALLLLAGSSLPSSRARLCTMR